MCFVGIFGLSWLTKYYLSVFLNERIVVFADRIEWFDQHGKRAIAVSVDAIQSFEAHRGDGMLAGHIAAGKDVIPILSLMRDSTGLIENVKALASRNQEVRTGSS